MSPGYGGFDHHYIVVRGYRIDFEGYVRESLLDFTKIGFPCITAMNLSTGQARVIDVDSLRHRIDR